MSTRITLPGAPVVVAPGKLFLAGEYAVLEGAPAVLMAVGRNAVAQYIPGFEPQSPVVARAVERSIDYLGELASALPPGSVMVNTDQFSDDRGKLGLGSSAAAAVATVGAVFEYAGHDLSRFRSELFVLADDAHRAAQGGRGSGADVAAIVYGGFVRFQRPQSVRDQVPVQGPASLETLDPIDDLQILVFRAGEPVSTTEMLAAVQGLARRQKQLYTWLQDELGGAARGFAEAFARKDTARLIEAARVAHDALTALGNSAHVPIVPESVTRAVTLAVALGGAAKISGAGGGDVGVVFLPDPDALRAFVASCPAGIQVLDVQRDGLGVRRRRGAGAA